MTKPLRNVTAVLLICFTVLFVQLNRVQVFQAEALESFPNNNRKLQRNFGENRGQILTSDGTVVAVSEERPDNNTFDYRRLYPEGELYAHSVGYVSVTLGSKGLEQQYSDRLVGGRDNLVLNLDHELQQVARDALRAEDGTDRNGSIVALDPRTGEIKALWSYPSYDPEPLASFDSGEVGRAWKSINNDIDFPRCKETPACAKAYQEREFPGSTFKIVVAAAALDQTNGRVQMNSPQFNGGPYTPPPLRQGAVGTVGNYNGGNCGGTLFQMIVRSCNAGFAQIASEELGPPKMVSVAEGFGFNQKVPLDISDSVIAESNFPALEQFGNDFRDSAGSAMVYDGTPQLAQTAIGQNEVQATPLQMALVAAAVANDGVIPQPRLAKGLIEADNPTAQIRAFKQENWMRAMSEGSANQIREAMLQVVRGGTGTNLAIPNLEVGAKTGTADVDVDDNTKLVHAWVIAFAGRPGNEPELAVAVLVERQEGNSGVTGGRVAAPIAKLLFEKHFENNDG